MEFLSDRIVLAASTEPIKDEDLYQRWAMDLILASLVNRSFLGQRDNRQQLTNDDITKLVIGGIPEGLILQIIEMYDGHYDISCNALSRLRNSDVRGRIVEAIVLKALLAKSGFERPDND